MQHRIKSYVGKDKYGKTYEPTLFSEIYHFYLEAPKELQKELNILLDGERFEEAIEIIESFFDIQVPNKTRRQLTYAKNKNFLPREVPYGMSPEKAKKSKYWEYKKAPKIKHIGT